MPKELQGKQRKELRQLKLRLQLSESKRRPKRSARRLRPPPLKLSERNKRPSRKRRLRKKH